MSGKIEKMQTWDGISFRKLVSRTSSQYAEQTTIHGFWYLAQASHGLEKLLWLTVVSIAVFFSVFQTCSLYTQWQKSPVITTLESIALPIKDIEFPAVTVCPQGSLYQSVDAVLFKQLREYIKDKTSKKLQRKKRFSSNETGSVTNSSPEVPQNDSLISVDLMLELAFEFLNDVYPGAKQKPTELVGIMSAENPRKFLMKESILFPSRHKECDPKDNTKISDVLSKQIRNDFCPDGFELMNNSYCLHFSEEVRSYAEAKDYCDQLEGSNLLYIDSLSHASSLHDFIASKASSDELDEDVDIESVTSSQKIEPGTFCSTKGLDEISSENECKAAGEKRGLQWGNSLNGPGGFPGCVYADRRNKVYFNISPRPGRTKLVDKYSAICKGNRYHLGKRGAATCSIGQLIWDEMTCRNACKYLSIREKNFKTGYYMCYKDKNGDCYQNGKNDDEARPICQTSDLHLAPPGSSSCDYGNSVSKTECEEASKIIFRKGKKGRKLQVGSGGQCSDGGWGQVPLGCSINSGGDQTPHYKTSGNTGKGCIHEHYKLICRYEGCFVKNHRYVGHNMKELSSTHLQSTGKVLDSAEDCQKYCQEYKECEVFTYFLTSKKCFIKSQAGKKEASHAISGPKYCEDQEQMNFAWVSLESNDDLTWLQNLSTASDVTTNTQKLEQLTDKIDNNLCYTIGIKTNSSYSLMMKNSTCTSARKTICRLDNLPENQKIIRPKFPCLQQSPTTRLKRNSNDSDDNDVPNMDEDDLIEDEEKSYEDDIVSEDSTVDEQSKPLHIQKLDLSLDPERGNERKAKEQAAIEAYRENFESLDYEKSYEKLFELLWYGQLPCVDVKGITSEIQDELSFIKRCYWKNNPISCNSIFEKRPTEKGMCCSFNINKAKEIFKGSRYKKSIVTRQQEEAKMAFQNSHKPSWYMDNKEPIPEAGREKGLLLVVDGHTDKLSMGSVESSSDGFAVVIDERNKFPLVSRSNIIARPGQNTNIKIGAIHLQGKEEIRKYSPEKRQCYFPDEFELKIHKYYSQSNCVLECKTEFAAKCLANCNSTEVDCRCRRVHTETDHMEFSDVCYPWFLPASNMMTKKFCSPWKAKKFHDIMQNNVPDEHCNHCLPDCTTTKYDTSISYAKFRKCDVTSVGGDNMLCDLVDNSLNPSAWTSIAQNEYINANITVPWYLQTSASSNQSKTNKITFSNIRTIGTGMSSNAIFASDLEMNPSYDAFERDIGIINIFFGQEEILKYATKNEMSVISFMSQIGGSLGLAMGISFISIVEFIYWFTYRLFKSRMV